MIKVILLIGVILTGCASDPKVEVVTQVERIVVRPPSELLTVPGYAIPLDIDHATQRDVAQWILQTEERMQQLEEQIRAIAKFYEGVE